MSFFRALFDLSFSEYVTPKIIKFLYVVTLVMAALLWVGILIASFAAKMGAAVVIMFIVCPIGFIVQLVFTRVGYEILIVIFGIAENLRDMTWALTGGRKAPTSNSPAPQYPQPGQYVQPPQAPQQYPQAPAPQQQYPQYPQYPQQPQQPPQQYPPQKPWAG